ncbi:unnamed protein product [Sphagnum jensenii]|uniref:Kinesin-like protein n=1 Tax=Sphagnum jensenii TaxID=128206 RepID=A0ABP0X141_9BRYO
MEQQNNVAIQHQQLLHHSSNHAAVSSDSPNGDAVLARWLQSAGLQHLAAPLAAAALDHRLLPSLLMQAVNIKQQNNSQVVSVSSPPRSSHNEKDRNGNSVARIKVVVRKRPINKKELARKEEDIITINDAEASLTVHEPKVKVDLTAYVEKHEFVFDAVLDQYVSNDEVYRTTVEPIVPTIFQRTKATCFAYGQTGSGKTYTMQPLPLRATQDIMTLMQQPKYRSQGLQLWLSFFEIYGGKLYDLLNERRKLCMREDGRQQVCIVGLQEYCVSHVELVKEYIDKGNLSRSTGSTGANEESSRSHAILQLVIKKAPEGNDTKGNRVVGKISFIDLAGSERGADTTDNDRQTRLVLNDPFSLLPRNIPFFFNWILRCALWCRMEGAEINKSLLALKECIRALDNDQGHIPFRGSKLTEVLRDSFMGDSRTVMISCVSPNAGSCEHTLNTLRYADRVKGLSKNNNSKKDLSCTAPMQREATTSLPPLPIPAQLTPQVPDYVPENRAAENGRCPSFDPGRYSQHVEHDELNNQSKECTFSGRDDSRPSYDSRALSATSEKDMSSHVDTRDGGLHELHGAEFHETERVQVVLPSRRKVGREEKVERQFSRDDVVKPESVSRRQNDEQLPSAIAHSRVDSEVDILQFNHEGHINAILEEEEKVISAHRKEVEDTMEIVREEMKLLAEVDQPGSRIDHYVSELNYVLSQKAAGIVNLQARLARFQRHLKEQEILSRTGGIRQM